MVADDGQILVMCDRVTGPEVLLDECGHDVIQEHGVLVSHGPQFLTDDLPWYLSLILRPLCHLIQNISEFLLCHVYCFIS